MTSNAVDNLRRQLEQTSEKLKKTQFNLEAQRVEVKQLNTLYFRLKDQFNDLTRQKNDLEEEIRVLNHNYNRVVGQRNILRERLRAAQNAGDFEPIYYNKVWHHVRSSLTKRKRKKIYRDIIDKGIRQIVECCKARVLLTFGHEHIAFQWSEQELEFNRENLFNDGYVLPPNIIPPNRSTDPLDCERADDKFRFTHTKEEVRKVICVMDAHNIAYPAYHELHLLSQGVLPPLNQIKVQKKEMEDKLQYYIVPGVSCKIIPGK